MALRVDDRWPSRSTAWQTRTNTTRTGWQTRTSIIRTGWQTAMAARPSEKSSVIPIPTAGVAIRPTTKTGWETRTTARRTGRQAWTAVDRAGGTAAPAARGRRRRRASQPVLIYSYAPPTTVADGEWALPKRWPSRLAPAGLLVALGMGVTGMVVAQPGVGPSVGAGENTLAMRLPYVPSQLPAMVPGDWAKDLPSAALPWIVPIQQVAAAESLDPRLLASLVWVESNFDPKAVSPKGAVGLAQVMPETAKELGIRLRDPLENLAGGAHYLRINMERFGKVDLALAAYNGGPTLMSVSKTLNRLPDPDIRTYVTRVLQTYRGLGGET